MRLGLGERPGAARPHRPHAPHTQLRRQHLKVVVDLASLNVRGQADGAIRLMAGNALFMRADQAIAEHAGCSATSLGDRSEHGSHLRRRRQEDAGGSLLGRHLDGRSGSAARVRIVRYKALQSTMAFRSGSLR